MFNRLLLSLLALLTLCSHALATEEIVVLVVFSDDVTADRTTRLNYADQFENVANFALIRSELDVQFRFVARTDTLGFLASGKDPKTVNTWLFDENRKVDPVSRLRSWRDGASADLVLLLVWDWASTDCGSAALNASRRPTTQQPPRVISTDERENYAFASVRIGGGDECNLNKTVPHELGHLLYAEHDLPGGDNNDDVLLPAYINHGFRQYDPEIEDYTTSIMFRSNTSSPGYTGLFSGTNPSVTSETAAVTDFWRQNAPDVVARYRPLPASPGEPGCRHVGTPAFEDPVKVNCPAPGRVNYRISWDATNAVFFDLYRGTGSTFVYRGPEKQRLIEMQPGNQETIRVFAYNSCSVSSQRLRVDPEGCGSDPCGVSNSFESRLTAEGTLTRHGETDRSLYDTYVAPSGDVFVEDAWEIDTAAETLTIFHQAEHPRNHNFAPLPVVSTVPVVMPQGLSDNSSSLGFARFWLTPEGAIERLDIFPVDNGEVTEKLRTALADAIFTSFEDERQHYHSVYAVYRVEQDLLSVLEKLVTMPQCCPGDPKPPYCGPGTPTECP